MSMKFRLKNDLTLKLRYDGLRNFRLGLRGIIKTPNLQNRGFRLGGLLKFLSI